MPALALAQPSSAQLSSLSEAHRCCACRSAVGDPHMHDDVAKVRRERRVRRAEHRCDAPEPPNRHPESFQPPSDALRGVQRVVRPVRGARCAVRGARCSVLGARCSVRRGPVRLGTAFCSSIHNKRGPSVAQCRTGQGRVRRCSVLGARCSVRYIVGRNTQRLNTQTVSRGTVWAGIP